MPVLYFGNYPQYLRSKCRVITVGVNPSGAEFPADDPWLRFPNCKQFLTSPPSTIQQADIYLDDLNNYFGPNYYGKWFNALRPLLAGFNADFVHGSENTALHTDFLSPVPTDPTWMHIEPHWAVMSKGGMRLWRELVAALKPHIVLIALRSELKSHLAAGAWPVVWTSRKVSAKGRVTEFAVEHQSMTMQGYLVDLLFSAKRFREPFGGLSDEEKQQIGQSLTGRLSNW